jgi:hypothetical protein
MRWRPRQDAVCLPRAGKHLAGASPHHRQTATQLHRTKSVDASLVLSGPDVVCSPPLNRRLLNSPPRFQSATCRPRIAAPGKAVKFRRGRAAVMDKMGCGPATVPRNLGWEGGPRFEAFVCQRDDLPASWLTRVSPNPKPEDRPVGQAPARVCRAFGIVLAIRDGRPQAPPSRAARDALQLSVCAGPGRPAQAAAAPASDAIARCQGIRRQLGRRWCLRRLHQTAPG